MSEPKKWSGAVARAYHEAVVEDARERTRALEARVAELEGLLNETRTWVALHASPGAFGSAEALLARVDAALGKAKS
mgnify:CR=1 FL=1